MKTDEKIAWILQLWIWSLFTVAYFTFSGTTGYWTTPLIVGAIMFGITFIAWVYRLVYLAGRNSR